MWQFVSAAAHVSATAHILQRELRLDLSAQGRLVATRFDCLQDINGQPRRNSDSSFAVGERVQSEDWDFGKNAVEVKPDVGKAVIFTGNMCHKRGSHSNSRWGLLFNMRRRRAG